MARAPLVLGPDTSVFVPVNAVASDGSASDDPAANHQKGFSSSVKSISVGCDSLSMRGEFIEDRMQSIVWQGAFVVFVGIDI